MEAPTSILFTAVFQGKHSVPVSIAIGAYGNIMYARKVDEIIAASVEVVVSVLHPHHAFNMAGSIKDGARAHVVCSKVASFDTELLIRYGYSLLFRKV